MVYVYIGGIMKLNLKNENQINKFYKHLWFYKSFIFKHTKFYCDDDISIELSNIISALNIKNRRSRIDYIYDECCRILDDSVKIKNVCGFKDNKCSLHCKKNLNYTCGCCRKCIYKTNNGCPSKNVACKLFNCSEVRKLYTPLEFKDIKIALLLSYRQRLILKSDYFSLREDVLKDLYSYSIFYSVTRIYFRLIINYFKLLKVEK